MGNPFRINEKIDGAFEVERVTTEIFCLMGDKFEVEWKEEGGREILSLNDILGQVRELHDKKYPELIGRAPFIRVWYESGMWGVIFEAGNYKSLGEQWVVHGITKGYA